MSASQWFWLGFVLLVVFSGFASFKGGRTTGWAGWSGLLPYVLIFLLGWAVFGGPIK